MLILDAIWMAIKAVFDTPERIFFAAVLVILALAGSVANQNAAVATPEAQAKIRQYAAAKADAEAQAAQSEYTLLAGKIQAQAPGADKCASLHELRQTFVKERP